MLSFSLQCCDSEFYLRLAAACAEHGECYDELRPMGAQYWFSLPLRLGLAQEYSIVGHWLLLIVSTVLAALAIRHLFHINKIFISRIAQSLLGLGVLTLHGVIFWPVLSVALADAAAGLLCLSAMWLLILSGQRTTITQAAILCCAGLSLGLAVWIRSFYLYPAFILLALYLTSWLIRRGRRFGELLFLCALLPIFMQYYATYSRYGEWAYISPAQSNTMFAEHLNSDVAGYDTLVPGRPHRYFPACAYSGGWVTAIIQGDAAGIVCLLGSRFQFYFASDLRSVYIDQRESNNLFKYGENFDVSGQWRLSRGGISANTDISPDGTRNAESLIVSAEQGFEVETPVIPQKDAIYTWSLWLWAKQDISVQLRWFNAWNKTYEVDQIIQVTTEPTRYVFSGELRHAVYYLSLVVPPNGELRKFHAWGLQIEQASAVSDYQFHRDVHQQRHYSAGYAVLNSVLLLTALYALYRFRTDGVQLPTFFIGVVIAQALIILPEQRFIVAAHTYLASLALAGLLLALNGKRYGRGESHA